MKKLKKILIIAGVTLLLAVLGVVSVSAREITIYKDASESQTSIYDVGDLFDTYEFFTGEYWIIEPQDINTPLYDCKVVFFDKSDNSDNSVTSYVSEHTDAMVDFLIENWSEYGSGELNTDNFISRFDYYCSPDGLSVIYDDVGNELGYNTLNEDFGYFVSFSFGNSYSADVSYFEAIKQEKSISDFNYLSYGRRPADITSYFSSDVKFVDCLKAVYEDKIELSNVNINNEMLISNLQGQITELNTTITEKDAVITEKDTTIATLEGENAELETNVSSLESDVDGLNTQVSALTTRNTQLNATVTSLENQMQLKINKAYAEGLTDSETKSNLVPVLVVLITVIEVVGVVALIVTAVRKRRRSR